MYDLDTSSQELNLIRVPYNGSYIYKDQNNNLFNDQGRIIFDSKFETLLLNESKQQTRIIEKEDTLKKEVKGAKEEVDMSESVVTQAYHFQDGSLELILQKYDIVEKVENDDGDNKRVVVPKEEVMEYLFDGWKPGDKVKKEKKNEKKEKKEKKKRPLSGYTYFGQQNKEEFNTEIEKLDEKPKYVTYLGEQWSKLDTKEKEVWNTKAKEAFEESKDE